MRRTFVISILVLAASACGPRAASSSEAATASSGDEAQREEGGEERAEGEFPLGRRQEIAGTGLRIRPPRGSERAPIGATFIHPRRRIQVVVAAAEGDLSVHQQFRAGLRGEAEEVESEEITLGGEPATLVIDHLEQGEVELERVWVLTRTGTRSAAAMGVYSADRSDSLRGLVRASVTSLEIDPSVAIDPETAVGWRIQPIEGPELVRASSTNASYSVDGNPPENGATEPMAFLMPLPIEIPADQRANVCSRVLEQLVQVPSAGEVTAIEGESLVGCEVEGATEEEPRLATYAALVFKDDGAFMIGGTALRAQRDAWLPRFRAAARTVEAAR